MSLRNRRPPVSLFTGPKAVHIPKGPDVDIKQLAETVCENIKAEVDTTIANLKSEIAVLNSQLVKLASGPELEMVRKKIEAAMARLRATESESPIDRFVGELLPLLGRWMIGAIGTQLAIDNFIIIARKYVKVIEEKSGTTELKCPGCDENVDQLTPNQAGLIICECGTQVTILNTKAINYNITTERGLSTTIDEDIQRFRDDINESMGRQVANIDIPEICTKLDDYFRNKGLSTSDHVRQLPLLNGVRGDFTINDLRAALKETGYKKYYRHDILIAMHYWGWQPHNYTDQVEQLVLDFIKVKAIYDSLKTVMGRSSSMNSKIRLYYHLQARRIPYNHKMLKLVGTADILTAYERIFNKITIEMRTENPEWPFVSIPR